MANYPISKNCATCGASRERHGTGHRFTKKKMDMRGHSKAASMRRHPSSGMGWW